MLIQAMYPIEIIEEILKRPDALDTYLGDEVNSFLSKKIAGITEPTLLTINLRKANPIDYLFTKSAFGQFYKTVNDSTQLDCVFFINNSQARHLFWGLLAFMDGNIHRSGNHEQDFIVANNIKICLTGNELIFIGTLNPNETEILEFINDKGVLVEDDIHSEFSSRISHAMISDAIRNLKCKKFIYSDETSLPNKVYSINSKLH